MQIDIILEPDLTPAQVAEIAVAAENHGFRTLWHSNYHQNPDAFGAIVAVGGGGSVMGAIGIKMDPKAQRIVRSVREAVEIIRGVTSGQFFWAWHIKADREKSMYEARRELVFRGELLPPKYDMEPYVTAEEPQLVIDRWQNFAKAFWTRTGKIENVPESIVNRLISACSSAGDLGNVDLQIERFRVFEKAGLTELSIRPFDEPMAGLALVAEHVLPHFEHHWGAGCAQALPCGSSALPCSRCCCRVRSPWPPPRQMH